ncbi:HNH endonuclease signature motif containing protein [Novosphingobium sp.]|uniref:HNH endonuclease signature motif containing protein n=1 Tax=Novosphingobium sp. TaxID=1874826 RepID=UPI0038B92469
MAVSLLKPRLAALDTRRVKVPAKRAEAVYQTPEYRAWRTSVIDRANGQCEAMEGGKRCPKAAPAHRMFTDHRVEIRDGGAPFDPDNGQCLCGSHHTAKTAQARAARR